MLIKLNKKIMYQGKERNEQGETKDVQREYEEIEFQFETLTGRDLIAANREAVKIEGPSLSPILSMAYQAAVAAKAAKLPTDVIMDIEAADFTMITTAAQDFLLSTGLKM